MIEQLLKEFPDSIIQDGIKMHEHLAPGIILSFKMALRVLKEINPAPENIVMLTSETTRCIPDGLQAMCRYFLLNGNYHIYNRTYDVGKLALQVTVDYKDMFRLVIDDAYLAEHKDLYAWVYLSKDKQLPLEEIKEMIWGLDIDKAFKKVSFSKKIKMEFKGKHVSNCPICGESTNELSMIEYEGQKMCKTCAFFEK
ncbi:MAG: FmdE family protein [Promethearchaeota archaeon]